MNEYDDYLESYFIDFFKNMPSVSIPRDITLENLIILASKVEYSLWTSSKDVNRIFGGTTFGVSQPDGQMLTVKTVLRRDNNLVFRNAVTLERLSPPPLPWELLGLTGKQTGFPSQAFYFINFYSWKEKSDWKTAVTKLAQKLGLTVNTPMTYKLNCQEFIPEDLSRLRVIHLYGFPDAKRYFSHFIFTRYFDNKKVLLPLHWTGWGYYIPWYFFSKEQLLFFNQNKLTFTPKPIIILTDSIELAGINQRILDKAMVENIVWISWYGELNAVKIMNWTLFKGSRIYYLLLEHSGFGGKLVYETALAVKQQLDKVGVAEFKYISYLAAGINRTTQSSVVASVPTLYCPDEFEVAMTQEQKTLPITLSAFKDDPARLTRGRKILLTPLIRERSATLIWGKPQSGKTWVAANMALAMAIGKPALKGWCPQGRSSTILYIHGEAEGDRSLEGKLIVLSNTFPVSSQVIIRPQPLVSGAALSPIVWYKNHPANFFYWPIDKRQHISDDQYFTAIIQLAQAVTTSSPLGTIILDNVFSIVPSAWTLQNVLIRELKSAGWAVIIVAAPASSLREVETPWLNQPSVRVKVKPEFINHAYVDSIIKVKKRSCKDGKLTLGINIKSPWCAGSTSKFDCFIDFTATPAIFEQVKQNSRWAAALKKPRQQLISEIEWLAQQGAKERQIAETLGITLSMVKKLRREAGLTKRRSKPYQYPENLRYPSLS